MAEVAHRAAPLGASREGFTIAAPVQSMVLPAAALVTLAVGLVILMLPGSPGTPELPPALFMVALAMLVATLLLSRGERSAVAPLESHKSLLAPVKTDSGATRLTATPGATDRARPGVPERGSAWRILSSPAGPGDETWLSWLPRERRRLGPEAPVAPDVVTSPGRAGNLVAFPVRDYFGGALPPAARGSPSSLPSRARERGLVGDEHLPALSSPRATPYSEEELDRMFPPEDRRGSVFLAAAPDRIGGRSPWSNSAGYASHEVSLPDGPDTPSGGGSDKRVTTEPALGSLRSDEPVPKVSDGPSVDGPDARATLTPVDREAAHLKNLSLEAANPIPPHLRATGAFLRTEPQNSAQRGRRPSTSRSVCASCSKVVVDLRLSGPCPKCLRPLCHDCLREAFVTGGHGWCLDCSSAIDVAG